MLPRQRDAVLLSVFVYLTYVATLPVAEQLWLMAVIAQGLEAASEEIAPRPKRSIMELYGVGKSLAVEMDAQEYVNRLREGASILPDEDWRSTGRRRTLGHRFRAHQLLRRGASSAWPDRGRGVSSPISG